MMKITNLSEVESIVGMKQVYFRNDGIYVQVATSEEIEAERLNKWRQIEAVRDEKCGNGVFVNGFWWQTSVNAKIRYMGAAAMGESFVATESWKTMTGEKTTLTGGIAAQIMMAIAASDAAVFKAAEDHKTAMMAVEDPSVYDFSTGWPDTFGEYQET